MRFIKFAVLGVLFGVLMSKSEVISWYRIYEMFRFESYHMYGIIGSAVILGVISIQLIKRKKLKTLDGREIRFQPKAKSIARYIVGGTLFGMGWALVGACPGPMFVLVGHGYAGMLIVIAGAVLGTFAYGMLRNRLPH